MKQMRVLERENGGKDREKGEVEVGEAEEVDDFVVDVEKKGVYI